MSWGKFIATVGLFGAYIISIGISDIIIGTVSRMRGTLWYTMRYFRWNRRKVQLQDAEIIVSKKRSYEAAAG